MTKTAKSSAVTETLRFERAPDRERIVQRIILGSVYRKDY